MELIKGLFQILFIMATSIVIVVVLAYFFNSKEVDKQTKKLVGIGLVIFLFVYLIFYSS